MNKVIYIAVMVLAVIAGCSSISVNYDYDQSADFQKYGTYAWLPQPTGDLSGNANQAMQRNSLMDQRIKRAVTTGLGNEGMVQDANAPDMFIVYHTGVDDKIMTTTWGYTYGSRYWGYGYGGNQDMTTMQYQKGTLILDFIDAASLQLVWRGTASGILDDSPSPQQQEEAINEAIAGMLQHYPPKK